ncbi:MAG: DUF4382 domain-containing protein [Candidatus Aenigmarchaeota archaeon]|nr:DUF4382 domain-containing protein [Candidatus Aenigmarchaeota archaeon]
MKFFLLPVLLGVVIAVSGCTWTGPPPGSGQGNVIVTIKDAPLQISDLEYESSLSITINSVELHDHPADKWFTVSTEEQTVDLLGLQNAEQLIGQTTVPEGTYRHVRLGIKSAYFVRDDSPTDVANVRHEVKVPSSKLLLEADVVVEGGKTSYTNLDFDLDRSLHFVSAGSSRQSYRPINRYVLRPVIITNSKADVDAEISADKKVTVTGGRQTKANERNIFDELGKPSTEEKNNVDTEIEAMEEEETCAKGVCPDGTEYEKYASVNGQCIEIQYIRDPCAPLPNQNQTNQTQANVKSFTIEADDNGFYPSGPFIVNKGDSVKILFKVRSSGVYYGGLDMRSNFFNTGTILPGNEKEVEFTATSTFTFTSYWPASGRKKADGLVVVGAATLNPEI